MTTPSVSATGRLDTQQAAKTLGLSGSLLNRMRAEGRGPRFVRLGGRVFYRQADLDAYIEAGVVETTDSRRAERKSDKVT